MKLTSVRQLQVKGFLSIRDATIDFRPINLLLGANGTGKSNLLRLFQLLQSLADDALQQYVGQAGGASALLHYGRKHTDQIEVYLQFERSQQRQNTYFCRLVPTAEDTLILALARHVRDCLRSYRVHHFHDTSESARVKQRCYLYDNYLLCCKEVRRCGIPIAAP